MRLRRIVLEGKSRIVVAFGACAVFVIGCGFLPEEEQVQVPDLPEPPQVSAVATHTVEKDDIYEAIEGMARVSPLEETSLFFRQRGRVRDLMVSTDQEVAEGDMLAQLEIDALEHDLELARIDLAIAETNLEEVAMNGRPVDQRILELEVERSATIVERRQRQIEDATIRAPHPGEVRRVMIEAGDEVREYESVIDIANPAEMELRVSVSRDDYNDIDSTMEAEVQVDDDEWVPIEITRMTHRNPRVDETVDREEFLVHLSLPETDEELNMYARHPVRIYIDRAEDVVVIPAAALREHERRKYVQVLEEEGVRAEVDVRVGIRSGTHVEILEGLSEGDEVIRR